MAKRPLLGLALAFAAGTAAGLNGARPSIPLLLAVTALAFLLGWHQTRRGSGSSLQSIPYCGWLGVAAGIGALSASLRVHPFNHDSAPAPPTPSHQADAIEQRLTGTIRSSPVWIGSDQTKIWRFTIDRRPNLSPAWSSGSIQNDNLLEILWIKPQTPFPPVPGEQWMFYGQRLSGSTPRLRVFGNAGTLLQDNQNPIPLRRLAHLRRWAIHTLARGIEDDPAILGLIRALTLGDRSDLPPGTRALFRTSGILHIIAISGLHVGMLAWLITLPLRVVRLSRFYWILVLAPLLILYTALAGAPPSAVRACIMALFFFAAPLFGRRPDASCSIAAAAILILAWDPYQLQEPGFLLSFAIAGGLIGISPLLACAAPSFLRQDPWMLPELEPLAHRLLRFTAIRLWELFLVSAAAWLIALPLTARYFGQLSLLALPANLAAVPLAFLLVALGALSLAADLVFPPASLLLNRLAAAFGSLLLRSMSTLAAIPFGTFFVPKPSVAAVAFSYLLLVTALHFIYSKIKKNSPNRNCFT